MAGLSLSGPSLRLAQGKPPGPPAIITNGTLVNFGDSISIGAGGGGGIGALGRMTFPVGVTLNNTYGVSSTALSLVNGTPLQAGFPLLSEVGGIFNDGVGVFPALWQADRPTVAVLQRGTNDIGTFANANAGANGADLYRDYTRPMIRLLKAQGAWVAVATLLNRSDALMTPAKQTQLAAYNAAVIANTGGADRVIDINSLTSMTDPTNATNFADQLHPTPAGQILLAPAYQAGIDPLLRGRSARPVRTVNKAFAGAATFSAGQFGLGISGSSGNTFIDQPTVPYDMAARPISIEFWWKPTAVTAQGIIGKLNNPSGTPQFLVGIDATGKYYMNVANGTIVPTTVTAVVNQSVYIRFIATTAATKLEINGANQVTTTTLVPTGGTRALRYLILDPEHGVANASGVMSGFASWDEDRSGVASPTDDLGLVPTANLRGFLPFNGHLQGWNFPLALVGALFLGVASQAQAPQAPQGGQQANRVAAAAFFDSGSFGTGDTTGGFSNA